MRARAELLVGILASAGAVALVSVVVWLLEPRVPVLSLGALYVLAVLPIAIFWGTPLAAAVAVASMLAFNWFFLPPTHTFQLRDGANWLALVVYLAIAFAVSALAARARARRDDAEQRRVEAHALAEAALDLLRGRTLDDELGHLASLAAGVLGVGRARLEIGEQFPGQGERALPVEAGLRWVATLFVDEGATIDDAVRERFLPGLAALLAVVVERSHLEAEALEAEALRRSDALKTALLRAVSHDLRSPLTAILASADALASRDLVLEESDRRGLAEGIHDEATRLDRVVEQLLDLSRLEAGQAEPHRELWHVDELVGQALAGLGDAAARVRLEIAPDEPPVEVDAAQVERVLANLLENALRYSPNGTSVIVRAEHGATELRLHVVDRGPGLPSEERDALFKPFRRGARGARLGVGPRHRARLRGGERWATLGAGRPGRRPSRPQPAARRHARSGASERGARMSSRVLVVDDEPQILRALKTSLRGAGYEVETAETVEQALSLLAANPPDAVVLDLVLPDGSGVEICRELRTWSTAPVIVLSVVGDEAEKVAALDAGADDYVTKPFGIEELLARLRAALRRVDAPSEPVVVLGDLRIDLDKRAVSVRGEPVQLTPHEFALLRVLARNPGKLLTHTTLLREVWGRGYGEESHYLHVYVSQLRRKLEPDPARPRYILTEPGAGYRLADTALSSS